MVIRFNQFIHVISSHIIPIDISLGMDFCLLQLNMLLYINDNILLDWYDK